MTQEMILYIILGLFIWEFILTKVLGYLNNKNASEALPKELAEIYDEDKFKKSRKYEKTKYNFGAITWAITFVIMLSVLVFGGFGWLYNFVWNYTDNIILQTLYFFGVISLIQTLIGIPSGYYSTFVIEEKFGFNKMTKKLFFTDIIKGTLLSFVIGWVLLGTIMWIYLQTGAMFWIYTWILVTLFSVFMMMFYSSVIVPLFNKQTPLEEGELRSAIEKFSTKVGFKLDNIYVIDGSKRSSKANAYFSGFGPKKRIVLYDTLINDVTTDELVAVLAHEIGHYKRKHTLQMLAFGILQTGIMFFILGKTLGIDAVSQSLGGDAASFALGMVAFGILYTPISIIFWMIGSILSRKNEYEADAFAAEHLDGELLISALKKLSRNNLSNLEPHPAYEFFYYSHPNPLKRFAAIRNIK